MEEDLISREAWPSLAEALISCDERQARRSKDARLQTAQKATNPNDWRKLAMVKKQQFQKLLHRELNYSGIIKKEMSYSAIPLAMVGIETCRKGEVKHA